jgi:hypothetical protein
MHTSWSHRANAPSGRRDDLDALRGLMLVLMAVTHLPTRFAAPLGQPFGFVSAAEGFVLISAFLAGRVYTLKHERGGLPQMRSAFLKRVLKIYACQAGLLALLLSAVGLAGTAHLQPAVQNLLSFYWEQPLRAFASGLLLLYNPPLLDILPMYIFLMLLSPIALVHGVRHGWAPVLAASVGVWVAAQFGLGMLIYDALVLSARTPLPPPDQTGSFSLPAWQVLWVVGLWMGATRVATAPGELPPRLHRPPRWMLRAALVVALVGLAWRHAVGQAPFGANADLNLLFDKWRLGPLRLLNLFALVLLLLHYGRRLRRLVPLPRPLQTLGAASLPVFVAHLVLAFFMLAWLGEPQPSRPWWLDAAALAVGLAVLYGVACVVGEADRRSAQARRRLHGRSTRAAGDGLREAVRRSRDATARNRPR